LPKENDSEGIQDRGGKHGGQAGMPKSPERPRTNDKDQDVVRKEGNGANKREGRGKVTGQLA
jgi:hypothetical protein